MTEVFFHFNVADRLDYACRLLRKAHAGGSKVAVLGDAPLLEQLDRQLWTFSRLDFIPHCRSDASAAVRAASPIVLGEDVADLMDAEAILLQLADALPPDVQRFARVVEIVSTDPEVRQRARQRWRGYEAQGCALKRHDAA